MSGKEYVSQIGKIVPGKMVKSVNCSSCKFKCSGNISEQNRQKLFELFWSLDTYEARKYFIILRIDEKQTRKYIEPDKETGQKRKRDIHRPYFFDIDGTKTFVCKKFFKQTLDVGNAYIDNAMKKNIQVEFLLAKTNVGSTNLTIKLKKKSLNWSEIR